MYSRRHHLQRQQQQLLHQLQLPPARFAEFSQHLQNWQQNYLIRSRQITVQRHQRHPQNRQQNSPVVSFEAWCERRMEASGLLQPPAVRQPDPPASPRGASSTDTTPYLALLQKGPDFRVANRPHLFNILAPLDALVQPAAQPDTLHCLHLIGDRIFKKIQTYGGVYSNLTPNEQTQLKRAKRNHTILFPRMDKGRGFYAISPQEYDDKIMVHLCDSNTYKRMPGVDPLVHQGQLQNKLTYLLQKLYTHGDLTKELQLQLNPRFGPPSRFYGLPKVHKPAVPLRPVVSMIQPCHDRLSLYLQQILSRYTSTACEMSAACCL